MENPRGGKNVTAVKSSRKRMDWTDQRPRMDFLCLVRIIRSVYKNIWQFGVVLLVAAPVDADHDVFKELHPLVWLRSAPAPRNTRPAF